MVEENVKCLFCLLTPVFAVSIWLQHRVLASNKHGVHYSVLEEKLNFLTLPFSIHVPPIISFRFFSFFRVALKGCDRVFLE